MEMPASDMKRSPQFLTGILLTGLAALRCFVLPDNTPLGRVLVPLALLGLGALCLWLLRREGYENAAWEKLFLPIALALFLRAFLLPHATLDYQDFLSQWVQYFRDNGGVLALKDPVGNYNVPYLYLLAILSYLPIPDLYGIKLFSILFDVLLAWGGLRLAKYLSNDKVIPLRAFALLLLLPTVILNGSCWGQCDSVWGALCALALADALGGKSARSFVLLSMAFAFKLQAIFLIPLWLPLLLTKRVKWKHLPLFFVSFFACILPALLFGKPLGEILGVYVGQASDSVGWQTVNYNSPSVFSLFPYDTKFGPAAPKAAIVLAFLFMLAVLALLLVRRGAADNAALALAGAALSLGIPFFLPYMHERYFFLGGVLLAVWACAQPRHAPAAIAAELASLGGYHAYLMKRYIMTIRLFGVSWAQLGEGLLMTFALVATLAALVRALRTPASPSAAKKR